jgi:hypothetical protein
MLHLAEIGIDSNSGVLLKNKGGCTPFLHKKVSILPSSHFLEVDIRHFKNLRVGIRRIPAYTPQYSPGFEQFL